MEYSRRRTNETDKIGNHHIPVVIISGEFGTPDTLSAIDYDYSAKIDKWNIGDMAPEYIYLGSKDISYKLPGTLKKIFDYSYWKTLDDASESFPLFNINEYLSAGQFV